MLGLPVFDDEDRKACEDLYESIRAAVKPPNVLVDILARDIVYETLSIARHQRYEVMLTRPVEESEKIYRTDRVTETAISVRRLGNVQKLVGDAQQRRFIAFKQIEYISTTFAKALRQAIAEAELQLNGSGSDAGESMNKARAAE